jgi:hypothetical protein
MGIYAERKKIVAKPLRDNISSMSDRHSELKRNRPISNIVNRILSAQVRNVARRWSIGFLKLDMMS